MATITVTNRKASQALAGQSVTVTLNASDSAQLPNITQGMQCQLDSNNKIGYVHRVDTYGNSFTMQPIDGNSDLASNSTPSGYLANVEDIIITTS